VADNMIAVRETAALLDLAEVDRAAEVISRAGRVEVDCAAGATSRAGRLEVYAAAGSAIVGAQLRESLAHLGLQGIQSGEALGPRDAAIGISHGGHTHETVDRLAKARTLGAKTIALTSFRHSPLAELADILLLTTTIRPQALSARHPQLMVLDLLCAAVAQRIQGAG
jgi:DNA-binding MurR/RpiR family transcriptional regulator